MDNDYSIMRMYAVSPCHAGSGSSLGTVDSPIQRERHTNWPVIQSSGMKGALRANFDRYKNNIPNKDELKYFEDITKNIFGTDKAEGTQNGYAGAISVSDAKILAFPMRSSAAPFVWITCPAVLKRLSRDLAITGIKVQTPDEVNKELSWINDSNALCVSGKLKGAILLEDYEVKVEESKTAENLKGLLKYFEGAEKILVVDDKIFDYGVSDCTQITAQIAIDQKTGTTTTGSLRYQEELPADSLMYCIIHWGETKNMGEKIKAGTIRQHIKDEVIKDHIQVGGDETMGRGIFELKWM
jgi:CRISPR-associated protein Cmr4